MNLLEIIVLVILAVCAVAGYCTGFLRVIYSLFSWTLSLALGTWASPHVAVFLEQNTGIQAAIQKACVGYITGLAKEKTADSTIAVFGELLEGTGIYEGIAAEAAGYIIRGVSFFLVMFVIGILMHLLWRILDLASRIPVVKGANRLLGAAVGALKGLVIVWGIFGIIQLCSITEAGGMLLNQIQASPFLSGIYEYNFLFRIVMKIVGF